MELLKQQENKYYGALFGDSSEEASDDRVRMYNNVCDIFNQKYMIFRSEKLLGKAHLGDDL